MSKKRDVKCRSGAMAAACFLGLFVTTWGSVIQQAKAETAPPTEEKSDGSMSAPKAGSTAKAASSAKASDAGSPTPPVLSDSDRQILADRAQSLARYNDLRPKGVLSHVLGFEDTILQDADGLRPALADKGIGVTLTNTTIAAKNLFHTDGPQQPSLGKQDYWGQKLSAFNVMALYVTYDTSRWGVPDGQISVGATWEQSTYQNYSADRLIANNIWWYQTALQKHLEIKAGLFSGVNDWGGFTIGGGAVNPLGANASVPFEMGLSATGPQPALNLTWRAGNLYDKMGAMRSIAINGPNDNVGLDDKEFNPTGLKFSQPNGKLLLMNELGYKREASPRDNYLWLRFGLMHNQSTFNDYSQPGYTSFNGQKFFNGNFGARTNVTAEYLLADYQLFQFAPNSIFSAYRGIYVGGSFYNSPEKALPVYRTWEARAYVLGPFASRPRDLFALAYIGTANSQYLQNAVNSVSSLSGTTFLPGSKQFLMTYTAAVSKGLYVIGGLDYIDNPSETYVVGHRQHALNLSLAMYMDF